MMVGMTRASALAGLLLALVSLAPGARNGSKIGSGDPRLKKAFRKPTQNGWVFVHLEGKPAEIGFQHGYLLAAEVLDAQRTIKVAITHDSKDWNYFRGVAERVLWPHIETEYREELQGIVDGLTARGVSLDLWDMVATNAWLELDPYYVKWAEKNAAHGVAEHCSAFVATGSYTKDHRPVIAHNNWTDYMTGSRWNMIFHVAPEHGQHFIMDGMPGLIHSGDDFGINSAGLMITETTIIQFHGFDPEGVPEFVRARKAMQYSESIDDFARIMKAGNNGGYANDWLIADRKTGEIASLELGLKHVNLSRTRDGYFAGSNYPIDPALTRDETDFDIADRSISANARHIRWDKLMTEHKGKIDVSLGQRFLGDHFDTFSGRNEPGERTLCGHIELSPPGSKPWQPPYGTPGSAPDERGDATTALELSPSYA